MTFINKEWGCDTSDWDIADDDDDETEEIVNKDNDGKKLIF